jgi:hypothetical protein
VHGLIKTVLIWNPLWAAILLLAQVDLWNPLNWALIALLATTATCLLAPRTPQPGGRRSGRLRIT